MRDQGAAFGDLGRKNKDLEALICFDTPGAGPYYTRPMSPGRSTMNANVANVVDAQLLAARDDSVRREFGLDDMPRLTDVVKAVERATLTARFHKVDDRIGVAGTVNARLAMCCQRCLRDAKVAVDDEFHVVVVASEAEAERLPERQDAIVADPARLNLAALAEEQVLLALPLVPVHVDMNECVRDAERACVERTETEVASTDLPRSDVPQRPFANLRELMSTKRK